MRRYSSTKSCTSNEKGEHEVELIYKNGLIRSLLKLPESSEIYVGGRTVWHHKGTGKRAGPLKAFEICDVVECHRQQSLYAE